MSVQEKRGVLVLAHGSRNSAWVQEVDDAVGAVESNLPVEIGYLELVEGRSIADGIRRLEAKGVAHILAIPLFVSSGSTHLEEIRWALGLQETTRAESCLPPISVHARMEWGRAMDDHPLMLDILSERAERLSRHSEEETLLLVAHGSTQPGFRDEWEKGLSSLAMGLQQRFGFRQTDFAMVSADDVAEKAGNLAEKGELLVLPVFLSKGYFTKKVIPQLLEGIPCQYEGITYLPHPSVSRWLEEQIREYNP
ncbi:hypothetical protein GCM10011571_30040 [Marinithermofilum abyssi]|uniref:Cobalamin biosynthesis protein CbiX n=1 Tax=Marinithermofilum abyssi TaxID=1571185 RepID=A0A8J2Y9L5_9BACL|nr:CbiX/SirB N-terminal domain-containing protein [Marinithermofilum abyssi]GGE25894.1 hypothetical protein GCM10011571_30040 [Marinithermofilum abyssi]